MYEIIIAVGIVSLSLTTVLAIAIFIRVTYMYVFFTGDDDIIKPKDYLLDDLYDTKIGGKK